MSKYTTKKVKGFAVYSGLRFICFITVKDRGGDTDYIYRPAVLNVLPTPKKKRV